MPLARATEFLYRLSLLVDESKGFVPMLRGVCNQTLQLLGGVAAVVLECPRPTDPGRQMGEAMAACFTIPIAYPTTSEFTGFLETHALFDRPCPAPGSKGWDVVEVSGLSFVTFDLADFGYWVLVFAGTPPPTAFLSEMSALAARLASACKGLRRDEALRRSQLRAELALAHGNMGIWEWDVTGEELFWDDRIRELFGVSAGASPSIPLFLSLIPANQRAETHAKLLQAREKRVHFDFSVLDADGRPRHLEGWGGPLFDEQGALRAVIGVGRDVTEKKTQERELRVARDLGDAFTDMALRLLQEEGSDLRADIDGALADVGKALAVDRVYVFTYDLSAEVAHNTHEWCAPGIEPQIQWLQDVPFEFFPQWMEAHRLGENVMIPDVLDLAPDDPTRILLEAQDIRSVLAIPMIHNGVLRGFTGFDSVRAVKHWTFSEATLLQVMAELLVNSDLRREREMALGRAERDMASYAAEAQRRAMEATQALEAKSHFMAVLSHEIRTPLTGVLGMVELLQDSPDEEDQQRYLAGLRKSGILLKTTIDRFLNLAKMEAGKLELETVLFGPSDLVHDAASMFEGAATDKGLVLDTQISPNLPEAILGDRFRLQEVMSNLLNNAIKFTEVGSVRAFADYREAADPDAGGTLVLGVEDTGIGFESHTALDVTQAFSQGTPSTAKHFEGSGLGLAIVRELALLMDGELLLSSAPGTGSRVWIELPVARRIGSAFLGIGMPDADTAALPLAAGLEFGSGDVDRLKDLRILVADDNAESQALFTAQLQILGAEAVPVANGLEALVALKKTRYDLAIVDCHMPVMGGAEAISQVHAPDWAGPSPPPILATSADVTPALIEQIFSAGASGFLRKPFSRSELLEALARILH